MTWHDATTTKPPVGERVNIHTPNMDEVYHVAVWDCPRWRIWRGTHHWSLQAKHVASWSPIDPPPKRDKGMELVEAFDDYARKWGWTRKEIVDVDCRLKSLAAYDEAKTAPLAYIRELEQNALIYSELANDAIEAVAKREGKCRT